MNILIVLVMAFAPLNTWAQGEKKEFNVSVTDKGFEPKKIQTKAGKHVILNITRKTDATCATQVQVPTILRDKKIDLPLNKTIAVDLGEVNKGEIKFGCGMDMMEAAQILVN